MRVSAPGSRMLQGVALPGAGRRPAGAVEEGRGTSGSHLARIVLLVFTGYYIGAKVGLALTFLPNPISVLWPPNAILLAALLLIPPRQWWVALAAALPAHLLAELQDGIPATMVLCWFVSNVTEALIGAACIRLASAASSTFTTPRNVIVFVVAAFLGALLSSFLDSAFVTLNRWGQRDYWEVWTTRLLSNVTAAVIVVPAIATWSRGGLVSLRLTSRERMLEAAALMTILLTVTLVVFDSEIAASGPRALVYLPLPLLLWATLRFGPTGASTSFAIVAFVIIWGAGHGTGSFGTASPIENALSVQLFLIFVAPTLLCLAAAMDERRRAEESLRASDKRFHFVLEATKDSVYERDIETGALWWSRNGLEQFGYHRAASGDLFPSWTNLIHPEDREQASDPLTTALESGDPLWESEFRVRRRDGSYAHVHEQGFIVRDSAGRARQLIGTLTDVTERRDTDELGQRLAHASRLTAMGELTASIAHEINQPMSAILHNVDAAEMLLDAGRHDSVELRQILADIRSDDLRASEVIRHIRALAKKHETLFEPFEINELVFAVLRLVSPIARRRAIAVHAACAEASLIVADRIHLQQVLLNLIFNAMDAVSGLPDNRRVIHIDSSRVNAGEVLISVRDHGRGVPPERIDRIFDSFFTTKGDGMGLGLSIARSLVHAHGGRIWAENNREGGATFRVALPVQPGERRTGGAAA